MLAAPRPRALRTGYDRYDPSQQDQGTDAGLQSGLGGGGGAIARIRRAHAGPGPGAPPSDVNGTATSPVTAPGGQPADPNAASGISQLPDGAGGAVAVPPLSIMAPSGTPSDATPWNPVTTPTIAPAAAAPGAAAAPAPAPWEAAAPGTFNADQNLLDSQITPGANDPSRIDIAKDYFDQLGVAGDRRFAHDVTDATNAAASHGQIGSGMLTNRYGDLTAQLNETNQLARRGLATDATASTIADNRSNRAEVRGERDYQHTLAQEAIQRRIQQQAAEQGQQAQDFGQAVTTYGLGNMNNPTADYLAASGQASGEAGGASSSVQQLIAALLARRGAAGG